MCHQIVLDGDGSVGGTDDMAERFGASVTSAGMPVSREWQPPVSAISYVPAAFMLYTPATHYTTFATNDALRLSVYGLILLILDATCMDGRPTYVPNTCMVA
jgi:hypothetical protein